MALAEGWVALIPGDQVVDTAAEAIYHANTMKITPEMVDAHQLNPLDEMYKRQVKAVYQEQWCRIYTGRSWFEDMGLEWAAHAAVMCDAREIYFGESLLAPLGGCDHPYDISRPCALKNWEHYKPSDEELARWWSQQR